MRRQLLLIGAALLLIDSAARAAETFWDRVQIHGFASQAAVRTSDNNWFGESTQTSFDFTEIGLNASVRLHPRVLLAGQALFRRAGATSENALSLDYGLADFTITSSAAQRLGLRVGRIKNPLGLYNETRDVPFTHPGIFLPQVVYFDRVRNLILSMDGAMVYGDLFRDVGNFSATIGGGAPLIDENVEWTYLGADFPGAMKPDGNTWLASLWYTDPSEKLKLGISGAMMGTRFDPANTPYTLENGTTDVLYWILSAQYNSERWTVTAEYAREPVEWRNYGWLLPDRDAEGEGYYLQGTYRLRPDVELMLRYEEGYADMGDRDGSQIEAATGGLVPASAGFSKILTTGIRWDINRHWMVRAEYAYNNGSFILSNRENTDPDRARYWNLFSVQAAFRF